MDPENIEQISEEAGETIDKFDSAIQDYIAVVRDHTIQYFNIEVWNFLTVFFFCIISLFFVRLALNTEIGKLYTQRKKRFSLVFQILSRKITSAFLASLVVSLLATSLLNFFGAVDQVSHVAKVARVLVFAAAITLLVRNVAKFLSSYLYRNKMGNREIIQSIATRAILISTAIYTANLYRVDLEAITGDLLSKALVAGSWYIAYRHMSRILALSGLYVGRKGALLEFSYGGKLVLGTVQRIGLRTIHFQGLDGKDKFKSTEKFIDEDFSVLSGRDFTFEIESFVIENKKFLYVDDKRAEALLSEIKETIIRLGGLCKDNAEKVYSYYDNIHPTSGGQELHLCVKYPILRIRPSDSGPVRYRETKTKTFLALKRLVYQKTTQAA